MKNKFLKSVILLVTIMSCAHAQTNSSDSFETIQGKCNQGGAEECLLLGGVYEQGYSPQQLVSFKVTKSIIESKTYYKKACSLGLIRGCDSYGRMLLNEAAEVFEKACNAKNGYAKSCRRAARTLDVINGKDTEKTKKFFKRGCQLKDERSCVIYKNISESNTADLSAALKP